MKINTTGIVIRELKTGETDRLVTILTPDMGLVRAFVRGGRSVKSRKQSATQLLSYSHLTLFSSRDAFSIDEAEPIEVFFELRKDILRTALAQYFCQLIEETATEGNDSHEILSLMLNSLYKLSGDRLPVQQLKAVFEMRLLSLSGFMPDIVACANCSVYSDEMMYFELDSAKIYCSKCNPHSGTAMLTPGVLAALRHICLSQADKIFSFRLSATGLRLLSEISEKYLLRQTGRRYKSLDFYHSILL